MPSRRLVLAAASFAALAAAPPAVAGPPAWLDVRDGVTQPRFGQAIEETVFVVAPLDTDADGRRDRIRVRIARPAGAPSRVPVIFEHSPYRGALGTARNHPVDVRALPQAFGARRGLPGSDLDDYYVPRGYAVVLGDSLGTAGSDGCPAVGGRAEGIATRAVVDWLNGRARGLDARGRRVRADWATGAVGMTGVSYDGTLANQAAVMRVRGLRTIVPVSAISSWYDYYRANGLVVAPHSNDGGAGRNEYQGEDTDVLAGFVAPRAACARARRRLAERQDRRTGDHGAFWRDRDYLRRAHRVRASVFLVHGLEDWNVRTKAFAAWWRRLDVPRKLWLHPGGHGAPADFRAAEHRWFDHWLFGVPNGIMAEPPVTVGRRAEPAWPHRAARGVTLRLSSRGRLTTGRGGGRRQSFVDRGRALDTDDVLIQDLRADHPNRLAYATARLRRPVRLSGTPRVRLRLAIENRTAANLTAVLVDEGPDGSAMVTRGWLDPQNRSGSARSRRVRRGRTYRLRWDLQPDDHVFAAGHRIGLVVLSTDHDYTLRPRPGTRITLRPRGSVLRLPLVGGRAALRARP